MHWKQLAIARGLLDECVLKQQSTQITSKGSINQKYIKFSTKAHPESEMNNTGCQEIV